MKEEVRAKTVAESMMLPPQECADNLLWLAFERDRSSKTRDAVFERFIGLAKSIAARLFRNRQVESFEFADYYQLACEGLLQAIDRYDMTRNQNFPSFAYRRIEGNVLSGVIKLSETQQQIAFQQRLRRERLQSLKSSDNAAQSHADALARLCEVAVSLAISFMLDDCKMLLPDKDIDPAPNAYDSLAWQQAKQQLTQAVRSLPLREQQLIQLHYSQDLDFTTIAGLLQLSKGRVSQLHRSCLTRLHKNLHTRKRSVQDERKRV
jgi:RNA polymerase sigma factor FliA